MPKVLTYTVELAVGAGCLVAALGARRRGGLWWVAALLAIAGAVAIVHAAVALS